MKPTYRVESRPSKYVFQLPDGRELHCDPDAAQWILGLYRAGLERAAQECETHSSNCAAAIRKLMEDA